MKERSGDRRGKVGEESGGDYGRDNNGMGSRDVVPRLSRNIVPLILFFTIIYDIEEKGGARGYGPTEQTAMHACAIDNHRPALPNRIDCPFRLPPALQTDATHRRGPSRVGQVFQSVNLRKIHFHN